METKTSGSKPFKELEMERKRKRMSERKLEEISLLEFTMKLVELIFKISKSSSFPVQETSLSRPKTLNEVKLDCGCHLVKLLTVKGICNSAKVIPPTTAFFAALSSTLSSGFTSFNP